LRPAGDVALRAWLAASADEKLFAEIPVTAKSATCTVLPAGVCAESTSVWFCPSDTPPTYKNQTYDYSYCLYNNTADVNKHAYPSTMESHSLAEAQFPAQKVLFWEVTAYHGNRLYVAYDLTYKGVRGDISNMTMLDGHTKTFHEGQLNPDVVNRFNPDWTVGGIGGMDFPGG